MDSCHHPIHGGVARKRAHGAKPRRVVTSDGHSSVVFRARPRPGANGGSSACLAAHAALAHAARRGCSSAGHGGAVDVAGQRIGGRACVSEDQLLLVSHCSLDLVVFIASGSWSPSADPT